MTKKFVLGKKVMFSESALKLCPRKNPYRKGNLILNIKTKSKNCVCVLWEKTTTPSIINETFITDAK